MPDRFDEARYRRRIEALEAAIETIAPASNDQGGVALLLMTATKATYPTAAGRFYWCEVQRVTATPTEGSAGTVGGTGRHVYARNVGTAIPPAGTLVLGVLAGPNYAFRYD